MRCGVALDGSCHRVGDPGRVSNRSAAATICAPATCRTGVRHSRGRRSPSKRVMSQPYSVNWLENTARGPFRHQRSRVGSVDKARDGYFVHTAGARTSHLQTRHRSERVDPVGITQKLSGPAWLLRRAILPGPPLNGRVPPPAVTPTVRVFGAKPSVAVGTISRAESNVDTHPAEMVKRCNLRSTA
jgi:hypothetical protein